MTTDNRCPTCGNVISIDCLEHRRCWCGGEVGPREPGDSQGLGCLEDIYHDWTGVP